MEPRQVSLYEMCSHVAILLHHIQLSRYGMTWSSGMRNRGAKNTFSLAGVSPKRTPVKWYICLRYLTWQDFWEKNKTVLFHHIDKIFFKYVTSFSQLQTFKHSNNFETKKFELETSDSSDNRIRFSRTLTLLLRGHKNCFSWCYFIIVLLTMNCLFVVFLCNFKSI